MPSGAIRASERKGRHGKNVLARTSQARCRIDGEQDQKLMLLQCVDERPLGELQAHRHR